jgi:hypothetical protein
MFNRFRNQEQPEEAVVPETKEVLPPDESIVIDYIKLTDLERDTNQCGVMIPNQMQCPQRAYTYYPATNIYLCAFHTANNLAVAPLEHKQYHEIKDK